jgi:predicted HAD superfamily Cof-like phosphohydrolase
MSYQVTLESSYQNQLNGVGLFHDVFGHPREASPVLDVFDKNMKLVNFRIKLINEEVEEFADEIQKNRLIHAIDAICDTLYVVNGAYHAIGAKFPQTSSSDLYTFEPVENGFHDTVLELQTTSIQNSVQMFRSLVEGLRTSASNHDFDGFVHILHSIQHECYNVASTLQFNVDLMFNVVQHCNMTKVCETEELANQSVEWYKENDTRYADPAYKKSTGANYWIIYNREDGKSLKSRNWTEPEPLLQVVLDQSYVHMVTDSSLVNSV